MLQINTKMFNKNLRLEQGLQSCTKQELTDIAKDLSVKGYSKLNKGQLAAELSRFMLENPKVWLNQMPEYELRLLDKLVDNGAGKCIETDIELVPNLLENFSLVVMATDCPDKAKDRLLIFEDLRAAIAPHVKAVLSDPENKKRFFIEQQFFGIANLYGMLPIEEMLDMLRDMMIDPMDPIEIGRILFDSLAVRQSLFDVGTEEDELLMVHSPFLAEPESLLMQLYQRRDIQEYKSFSKEEILAAGERPMPQIVNAKQPEIVQFFRYKLNFPEEHIQSSLCYIWFNLQADVNPMSVISDVISGGLDSMAQLQKAVELGVEYCNHMPRWFMKGFSPAESQSRMPLVSSTGQQGRNDLCSCGSGKKYKKCCGAN